MCGDNDMSERHGNRAEMTEHTNTKYVTDHYTLE